MTRCGASSSPVGNNEGCAKLGERSATAVVGLLLTSVSCACSNLIASSFILVAGFTLCCDCVTTSFYTPAPGGIVESTPATSPCSVLLISTAELIGQNIDVASKGLRRACFVRLF